ncbi:hypothetical protein QSU92_12305 [Microbacterium sp. ET2]|uniref:hypothetical protein n=1 Tax=Microbacterium albipurpureum TaxID=3050384 RepID=UPI00259C6B33|nr:hypothetical protein [Microbacterium sp. ET2 (Ac-2212)]WJL94746.1 hypothetical protein QSU92_12305 [Microbacterium sp. ET2 (Ac-2212)]
MSDLGRLPVSRRTLLQTSVWVAPVIASAVAVPSRTTSPPTEPTAIARADEFEGYTALTVESTEAGIPLPAGTYLFIATGGVSPTAEVLRVTPDLGGYVTPAASGEDTAVVVLPDGHVVSTFTVYLLSELIPATVDPTATLTVAMDAGIGASIPIQGSFVDPGPGATVFGPAGTNWPDGSRTPRVTDTFDRVVEVPPSWTEISREIKSSLATHPNGKVKILVEPGEFAFGSGSGSTDGGVLQDVLGAGRPWRILVVPRDGWGTVRGTGTVADAATRGYAFVNVHGVALAGFDFTSQGVLVRNSSDFAFAWSTFGTLGVTANDSDTTGIEFVECVLPDQLDIGSDRMALRAVDGWAIDGVTMRGCYVAPAYKAADDLKAHTDTIQLDVLSEGRMRNITIADTVLFPSSSQTIQAARNENITITRSAILAGLRGTGRYPLGPDRHVMVGENALWGGTNAATGVVVSDSVIMGSIDSDWSFASVTNTIISKPTPAIPASGSFTVDPTLPAQDTPIDPAWLAQYAPMPNSARLSQIWAELAA